MHFCSQSSRYAKQGLLKVLFSHVISLLNPRDLTYLCSNVLHSNEHKLVKEALICLHLLKRTST